MKEEIKNITTNLTKKATDSVLKVGDLSKETYENIMKKLDQNGDGVIDIEDIIILGFKTKGVRVDRTKFLTTEFLKKYDADVIKDIVNNNPMHANIPIEEINNMADEVIKNERNFVSGISAALSAPGGAAMIATIPADIMQYYGYMLRTMQKLLYLYGFPEIEIVEGQQTFDSEIMNNMILCLGVMYGVSGASNALKAIAKALASGVEKKLVNAALTKGTIYPIVKSVASWFGTKMTKQIFAGFFKKAIPVVGAAIGGGITFVSFKPCCDRLKDVLKDTKLSNPNYVENKKENIIDIKNEEP